MMHIDGVSNISKGVKKMNDFRTVCSKYVNCSSKVVLKKRLCIESVHVAKKIGDLKKYCIEYYVILPERIANKYNEVAFFDCCYVWEYDVKSIDKKRVIKLIKRSV